MAELVWSVLCRQASMDRESNIVSLLSVLEEIQGEAQTTAAQTPNAQQPLVIPVECELVSLWTRSKPDAPETVRVRLGLLAPSGQAIGDSAQHEVDLREHKRSRARMRLNGFPVAGNGIHVFTVSIESRDGEWEELARVPVEVRLEIAAAEPEKEATH